MMLIADAVIRMPHRVERRFAVLMRQRNQFASRIFFRRAAFVGIDVRVIAAQNSLMRTAQRLQSKHIAARSVERKVNVNARSEMLFEFRDCRSRVVVIAIGNHVALVGAGNRIENFWMHSGIVVAGKSPERPGKNLAA